MAKGRNIKHLANITLVVHGSRRGRGIILVNASYNTHDPSERMVAAEREGVDMDRLSVELSDVLETFLVAAQEDWRRQQALGAGGEATKPGGRSGRF